MSREYQQIIDDATQGCGTDAEVIATLGAKVWGLEFELECARELIELLKQQLKEWTTP